MIQACSILAYKNGHIAMEQLTLYQHIAFAAKGSHLSIRILNIQVSEAMILVVLIGSAKT